MKKKDKTAIMFRCGRQLKKEAEALAEELDVTVSQVLRTLLREWIRREKEREKTATSIAAGENSLVGSHGGNTAGTSDSSS